MSRISINSWVRLVGVTTIALASAALAHAGTQPRTLDPPPVKVSFSDLNLETEAGAKVLYGRIKAAATEACGPGLALWYPGKARVAGECFEQTVAHAVKQINRPMLTALHEHRVEPGQLTDVTAGGLTRRVPYAGLNLREPADVAKLYRRITLAAGEVCEPSAAGPDVADKLRVRRCVDESIARAVEDVHAPALTQYHAGQTNHADTSTVLSGAR